MADLKNSARRKRKYDNRASITARNKERKQFRHESRLETLKARTLYLIDKTVEVRLPGGKRRGVVSSVLYPGDEGYPKSVRKGAYLRVTIDGTPSLVHRRNVRPLPIV